MACTYFFSPLGLDFPLSLFDQETEDRGNNAPAVCRCCRCCQVDEKPSCCMPLLRWLCCYKATEKPEKIDHRRITYKEHAETPLPSELAMPQRVESARRGSGVFGLYQ